MEMEEESCTGARTREARAGNDVGKAAPVEPPPLDLTPDGYPTADEVVEMYELLLSRFETDHAVFTRPRLPGERFERWRTLGACGHLRDRIYRSSPANLPLIPAFMYANNPGIRYCETCARHEKRFQKYGCNLCGHANISESKLKRRTAVEFHRIYKPPMMLYVGVCDYCEGILVKYQARKLASVGPPSPIE